LFVTAVNLTGSTGEKKNSPLQPEQGGKYLNGITADLSAVISFPMEYYPHILLWPSVKNQIRPMDTTNFSHFPAGLSTESNT
jgi:hypothetical protein